MGPTDSFCYPLDHLILLANKKLVLNVDEALGSVNKGQVGRVDRIFFLEEADTPAGGTTKKLVWMFARSINFRIGDNQTLLFFRVLEQTQ